VARRGTQDNDEPDGTLVVDLEKYSIPDGTRCVSDVTRICEGFYFVISQCFLRVFIATLQIGMIYVRNIQLL